MADRGIIFSAPMVRALLDGRKMQTRRLLTSARVFATPESRAFTLTGDDLARALRGADRWRHLGGNGWFWESDAFDYQTPATRTGWMAHLSYAPGDRLYVREAFSYDTLDVDRDGALPPWYWADGNMADAGHGSGNFTKPKPSIHMPRWASRLWLSVTEVRVERLQEINEEDAVAEGIQRDNIPDGLIPGGHTGFGFPGYSGFSTAVSAYAALWNNLYTTEGERWEDNPWIVAVTFDVHRGNIDAGDGE